MFNFEDLSKDIVQKLSNYCENLYEINKDNILSINLLQGSLNLVVVLNELNLDVLNKNLKLVKQGHKKQIPAPLFFTLKHMESSSDVFPMDFLDMKKRYKVIYGKDVLVDIKIDNSNLRLCCEQELKGKLIRLRQVYLEVGLHEKQIKQLISSSFQAFVKVFMGMLVLKGVEVPDATADIITAFGKGYNVEVSLFEKIYNLEFEELKKKQLESFLNKYINLIFNIAVIVDQIKVH